MKRVLKCPFCGFEGEISDFTFMYEVVLYTVDHEVLREDRERPPLVICPKCKQGFFLESPYKRFYGKKNKINNK